MSRLILIRAGTFNRVRCFVYAPRRNRLPPGLWRNSIPDANRTPVIVAHS